MDARQKIDMPPLPARCHVVGGHYPDHTDIVDGYSAEQLREFARVYGVNIIATHTAELAAREAEIAGLREAGEKLVYATNYRQGVMASFQASGDKVDFANGKYWQAFDEFRAALTKQPPKD